MIPQKCSVLKKDWSRTTKILKVKWRFCNRKYIVRKVYKVRDRNNFWRLSICDDICIQYRTATLPLLLWIVKDSDRKTGDAFGDESLHNVANEIRVPGHYPAFGNGGKFLSIMGADLWPRAVWLVKGNGKNNKPSRYRSKGSILPYRVRLGCFSVYFVCDFDVNSLSLAILSKGLTRVLICIHVAKSELREARI